jgi:hypothetical protein
MSPRPERPSDAEHYERDRVELFSQGDLFRDVPLLTRCLPTSSSSTTSRAEAAEVS